MIYYGRKREVNEKKKNVKYSCFALRILKNVCRK